MSYQVLEDGDVINDAVNIDDVVMVEGCKALLRTLFGEDNWWRFERLRDDSEIKDLKIFIKWLLDLGEQDIYYDHKPSDTSQLLTDDDLPPPPTSLPVTSDEISIIASHYDNDDSQHHQQEEEEATVTITFINVTSNFHCQSCGVSLTDVEVVREHLNIRHQCEVVRLVCDCCPGRRFYSIPDYVTHHKTKLTTAGGSGGGAGGGGAGGGRSKHRFVCDTCAKPFHHRRHLDDHVATKHLKIGPRYECQACGKRFSHCTSFFSHKRKCPVLLQSL